MYARLAFNASLIMTRLSFDKSLLFRSVASGKQSNAHTSTGRAGRGQGDVKK
jgi:hypothetical protein